MFLVIALYLHDRHKQVFDRYYFSVHADDMQLENLDSNR
jgi:hypothetical protein